ncbi:thiopurine S-methyltransferase [Fulvimonas soli]|uniref:Thiopurine S-methyltransferase n=1 Tax=Fulvimonas soli TaxID=155197 RepID=A0A316HYU9_9GAMM|nr:thiopurine S-methyltransferase [Fulvimonas soli]PWK85868.1 thiopurine S-methyltransferase [Fulvimonas soli]TNY27233.1 thiopurine S-methyltransferase [Fulvimonas soli]
MDPEFWHRRWREGRIGFHQDGVTPLLREFWPALGLPRGSRVFVPLAGKSLDLAWLAAQGHRVLGVELSPLAVRQFFAEHGLAPEERVSRHGRHFRAGDIELVCGDVFDLDAEALADCAAVYDRAALIALPPPLRRRYAREPYARLPAGCRGLLVALEYPQHEKAGPPFSVPEDEVRALFGRDWDVATLARREILAQQPGFAAEGVSALATAAYRLARKA